MVVSLLISTYNWKEALALCLQSVFVQTVKPSEILIADDGSREDTRELIDRMRGQTDIPLVHVWHEDKGFRKTLILNKTISKSTGEYIIQVDGDVVLERHFIADHLELAEKGFFVAGSRVLLGPGISARLLNGVYRAPSVLEVTLPFIPNLFRSRIFRSYLSRRYAHHRMNSVRGCNMAFWKADAYLVNGYNEELEMWGQEDVEFACRLVHAGINKKQLKMGGVVYHLYHKQASRANLGYHNRVLQRVMTEKEVWCEKGIVKK